MYHTLVFCFAGNRDLPPLLLFLIASLILPSETLLTYCPYISTIVVYLFVVYSCPPLTEGNKGKSYLFGSIHDGRLSTIRT